MLVILANIKSPQLIDLKIEVQNEWRKIYKKELAYLLIPSIFWLTIKWIILAIFGSTISGVGLVGALAISGVLQPTATPIPQPTPIPTAARPTSTAVSTIAPPSPTSTTLSPTLTAKALLTASNQVIGANFGSAVSLSSDGKWAIVGDLPYAPPGKTGRQSAAYIFQKTGSNDWKEKRMLPRPPSSVPNSFGYAVAFSGDGRTVLVGAPPTADPEGKAIEGGVAYIYRQDGNGNWPSTPTATLIPDAPNDSNYFGESVALSKDGNKAVVGLKTSKARAYLFTSNNGNWGNSSSAALDSGTTDPSNTYHNVVAISQDGNTVVIGAAIPGVLNGWGVFIFSSSDKYTTPQRLNISNQEVGEDSGVLTSTWIAISGDGNTIFVGAKEQTHTACGYTSGKVYIFSRAANNWSQATPPLTEPQAKCYTDYSFGSNIAVSGDGKTVLIAASRSTPPGIAFLYRYINNKWVFDNQPLEPDQGANPGVSLFGWSVSLSEDGNTALIGATGDVEANPGKVYVIEPKLP